MDKRQALSSLEARMAADTGLPLSSRLVFGEGDPDALVLFIGEAPGAKEDELGRPFVGRGGQLLTRSIEGIGWERSATYITNIVKRRPPDNRDPSPDEIAAYAPYLAEQLSIIKPRLVVPLGRFSARYFLPDVKITRDQGSVFELDRFAVYPMLHPAAAMRGNAMMRAFAESFTRLPSVLAGLSD